MLKNTEKVLKMCWKRSEHVEKVAKFMLNHLQLMFSHEIDLAVKRLQAAGLLELKLKVLRAAELIFNSGPSGVNPFWARKFDHFFNHQSCPLVARGSPRKNGEEPPFEESTPCASPFVFATFQKAGVSLPSTYFDEAKTSTYKVNLVTSTQYPQTSLLKIVSEGDNDLLREKAI